MARWAELDRAKGLAIILVVFGHLVAREDPAGVAWYGPLRTVIYLFHMPFFLYLSGYVAVLSGAATETAIRRRAARLLVPFLAFGLLILLGKWLLAPRLAVDNPPASLADGLLALLWDTGRSPATSVWYLVVLFVYAAALPALLRRLGMAGLLGLGLVLFAVPAPALGYLDRICGYFVFFTAGVAAARAGAGYLAALDRWAWPALGGFGAGALLAWSGVLPVLGPWHGPWLLGLGLLSMPALHALLRAWRSPRLGWLGERVFPIYLLNTICIGLTKALLLPWLGWTHATFLFFAATLMAAGLLGPLVVARVSARAAPAVQRQLLG